MANLRKDKVLNITVLAGFIFFFGCNSDEHSSDNTSATPSSNESEIGILVSLSSRV